MTVPETVHELVDRFHSNLDAYKSGQFNEAQARVDFINPLFMALGWDINNRQGRPETYRDVVYEAAVKVGGAHEGARLRLPYWRISKILPRSKEALGQPCQRSRTRRAAQALRLVGQSAALLERAAQAHLAMQRGHRYLPEDGVKDDTPAA